MGAIIMLQGHVFDSFLKPEHRDMLVFDPDPGPLLDRLAAWEPPTVTKWIGQPGS